MNITLSVQCELYAAPPPRNTPTRPLLVRAMRRDRQHATHIINAHQRPSTPATRLIAPQPYGLVLASAADLLPIRTPVNGVHLILMPRQIHRQLEGSHGPDLERCVFGRRNEKPRVRRERTLIYRPNVSAQRVDKLAVSASCVLVKVTPQKVTY